MSGCSTSRCGSGARTYSTASCSWTDRTQVRASRSSSSSTKRSPGCSSGKADQAAEIFKRVTDEASHAGPLWPDCRGLPAVCRRAGEGEDRSGRDARVDVPDRRCCRGLPQGGDVGDRSDQAYADALKGFRVPRSRCSRANRKWQESIAEAEKALKSNGKTLTDSTDKGRDNARALDAMTRAAIDNVGAMQANRAKNRATLQASLRNVLSTDRGDGRPVRHDQGRGTQVRRASPVNPCRAGDPRSAPTRRRRRRAIKGLFNYWSSKTITLRVAAQQKWVDPDTPSVDVSLVPDPGTSDSILARLSNGEFVVRAAAVEHYGPTLLHQINAMRFADGGLVGAQRTSVNASVSFPSDGMAIRGSMRMLGDGWSSWWTPGSTTARRVALAR